ncbi:MAG: pentapeptide repeat-containing protein [Acidimicrobiia bacterium]
MREAGRWVALGAVLGVVAAWGGFGLASGAEASIKTCKIVATGKTKLIAGGFTEAKCTKNGKGRVTTWDDRVTVTSQLAALAAAKDAEKNAAIDATRDQYRAGLVNADLSGADLSTGDVTLNGADMRGANLSGANLTGAELIGADLTNANLTGTVLTSTDLTDSHLAGVDLSGRLLTANLTRANLTGVNLTGSIIAGSHTGVTYSNTTCPNGTNSNVHGGTCAGQGGGL